jgi:hypothetical protein
MVGYADDHSPDTYRMFNPDTNKVIPSRDVRWADWKRTDPYEELNVFKQVAETKNEVPLGIDDIALVQSANSNAPNVIPNDIDDDRTIGLDVETQIRGHPIPENTHDTIPGTPVPSPVYVQHDEAEDVILFEPEGQNVFTKRVRQSRAMGTPSVY